MTLEEDMDLGFIPSLINENLKKLIFLYSYENYTFYPRIILSLCKALLFASIASSTGPILCLCFREAEVVVLQIFSTYYWDSRCFVLFFMYFGAPKELLHFVINVVMSLVGIYSLFLIPTAFHHLT